MTALVIPFHRHPVRVQPGGDGVWFVIWRTWVWLHVSRNAALADAHAIAAAHGVRVIAENAA